MDIEKSASQNSVGISINGSNTKPNLNLNEQMRLNNKKKKKFIVNVDQSKIWMDQILKPSVEQEIMSIVKWKENWNRIAQWTEIIGKATQGISTVLAYSAGFFQEQNLILSFTAGASGTLAMVLIQYSTFAKKKSKVMESQIYEIMTDWSEQNITKPRADSISTDL